MDSPEKPEPDLKPKAGWRNFGNEWPTSYIFGLFCGALVTSALFFIDRGMRESFETLGIIPFAGGWTLMVGSVNSYLQQGQDITDQVFGNKFLAVDDALERHVAELKKLNKSHATNIEKFLKVFQEAVNEANKRESHGSEQLLEEVRNQTSKCLMHIWAAAVLVLLVLVGYLAFNG